METMIIDSIVAKSGVDRAEVEAIVARWLPPVSAPISVQKDAAKAASQVALRLENDEVDAFIRNDEAARKRAAAKAVIFREIERLCLFEVEVQSRM